MSNPGTSALRRVAATGSIGVERGAAVVCIPVYGQHHLFVRCFESVLANTPADVAILVADDASPDRQTERYLGQASANDAVAARVRYLRQEQNLGFVGNVNVAFAVAAPGDVVILNSDCEVGPRWLERLRDAALSDSTIATATALTNCGTIVSVPNRNLPSPNLPQGKSTVDVADAIASASLCLRPRIPTMVGHCVYVRRQALDLVGGFDPVFSPGYGEEVDFSQRCLLRGLIHIVADDVFVYHRGGASFLPTDAAARHAQVVRERYPYYDAAVDAAAADETGPLARALAVAARALGELTVTIDARCLGTTVTGTQVQILEVIRALWRNERASVRVLVLPEIGEGFRTSLEALHGVEILTTTSVTSETPRTAIIHRPYQVFNVRDLELIGTLGRAFVVTEQDLISFRNPGHFRSFAEWQEYRRLTRLTLALANSVLFFSKYAAADALSEELVDPARARVIHLGVDHDRTVDSGPVRPRSLPSPADEGFLLCIGTNFLHKNRRFALELADAMQRRHRWRGWLVFAGPHAARGTSALDEAAYLAEHPKLMARTIDLGEVTEAEKNWLLREAEGVVYPTVHEGFGLIPFEAAAVGTPCFFAAQSALAELLPVESATLIPWDADASADAVIEVIADSYNAAYLVGLVQTAARPLTWVRTAAELIEAYEAAMREPEAPAAGLATDAESASHLAARLATRTLGELALPDDVYQALLAIIARRELRTVLFRALTTGHHVGGVIRRRLRLRRDGAFV